MLPPCQAFFAPGESVPLREAVGRIAAEMVSPSPPGIPRLLPGERVAPAHVEYFARGIAAGMFIPDAGDRSLGTLRVVAGA